jgi:phage-related tail fiber protein
MKKFFAIALIAASFVACNEGEKTTTDAATADSIAAANTADSLAKAANAAVDSTAKAATDAIDSTAKAAADSLKK